MLLFEQITDDIVEGMAKQCPQLHILIVRGCRKVHWCGLAAVCDHCRKPEMLIDMEANRVEKGCSKHYLLTVQ